MSAQYRGVNYGKNLVSGEFGMFHRGLIGVSYVRLFVNQDRFLFGSGCGVGVGGVPGGGGVNQFYYATCYLAGGGFEVDRGDRLFISANLDLRYIDFHDTEYETIGNDTFSHQRHYSIFHVVTYIVISFIESDNLAIQMRIPPLGFFNRDDKDAVEWGGTGMSVGICL